MNEIREILVPTDFSAGSDAGVDYACALAQKYGARLHIMHVLQDPSMNYLGGAPPTEVHEDLEEVTQARLEHVLTQEDRNRYRAELVVECGSPTEAILRYAQRQNIDMIVMSTHGDSWATKFTDRVPEEVVRQADCPVITVPYPVPGPSAPTSPGAAENQP
jgi:nucleotide-binding universal stress UspA family protein